jgi:hypothetical protein
MKNTVTQKIVDEQIADIQVTTVYEKVTVVSVRLKNGFVLVESAGAVDKANYSEAIGKEICLQRIKNKIWELEGYRLSCELAGPHAPESLMAQADELCRQIERCGASTELTFATVLASQLAVCLGDHFRK